MRLHSENRRALSGNGASLPRRRQEAGRLKEEYALCSAPVALSHCGPATVAIGRLDVAPSATHDDSRVPEFWWPGAASERANGSDTPRGGPDHCRYGQSRPRRWSRSALGRHSKASGARRVLLGPLCTAQHARPLQTQPRGRQGYPKYLARVPRRGAAAPAGSARTAAT